MCVQLYTSTVIHNEIESIILLFLGIKLSVPLLTTS